MTWARDAGEEQQWRGSLPFLAGSGVPIFITDAGSAAEFLGFLRGLPNIMVLEADGAKPPTPDQAEPARASLTEITGAGT
jgi:hypothetical protein